MSKKLKHKLVIDRKKWAYKSSDEPNGLCSYLLVGPKWKNDENLGKMCCLGFLTKNALKRCGMKEGEIKKVLTDTAAPVSSELPRGLYTKIHKAFDLHHETFRKFIDEAIAVNDNYDLNRETKETRLKDIFAKRGIKLEFRG